MTMLLFPRIPAVRTLASRLPTTLAMAVCAIMFQAMTVPALAAEPGPERLSALPSAPDLAWIEGLYRGGFGQGGGVGYGGGVGQGSGDGFRAESEIKRLLHYQPNHPWRAQLELTRAKLYYREGRYRESGLMLYSLLDRHPGGVPGGSARRLLGFSQLRQGRFGEAERWLASLPGSGLENPPPLLSTLRENPPGWADPEAAERLSTWVPGAGFFESGQPGKALTGMGLNLLFLGAAVGFAQQGNTAAALLFLLFEGMLYQGGRSGARQDAQVLNRRLRDAQIERWLQANGEPALLRIGIETTFGGG